MPTEDELIEIAGIASRAGPTGNATQFELISWVTDGVGGEPVPLGVSPLMFSRGCPTDNPNDVRYYPTERITGDVHKTPQSTDGFSQKTFFLSGNTADRVQTMTKADPDLLLLEYIQFFPHQPDSGVEPFADTSNLQNTNSSTIYPGINATPHSKLYTASMYFSKIPSSTMSQRQAPDWASQIYEYPVGA